MASTNSSMGDNNLQVWKICDGLEPNSEASETNASISPFGFREYDARWLYPEQINLLGLQCLGAGYGTQLIKMGYKNPRVVIGHDYRWYSATVKHAVIIGLMSAGCRVEDIGLAVTPMAYFAQQYVGGECAVAMVTASHNENGWTGLKVGDHAPVTHGPAEMTQLKEIVLSGEYYKGEGQYTYRSDIKQAYIEDLLAHTKLTKNIRVVVAAGNGTMGAFAPEVLEKAGCTVLKLDCDLDWTFPRYNPNPEDIKNLHAVVEEVNRTGAELGLAFDGDGDRIGVVDNTGEEIFSDKVGLIIARELSKQYPGKSYVVDVKSTGLYRTDPVLKENNAETEYWKTGHSYLKRRINETQALAGFEKSGHFFFNAPVGRGYDDALISALQVLKVVESAGKPLSEIRNDLGQTWQTPTMSPYCDEDRKYKVVDQITKEYEDAKNNGELVCGLQIADLITVNGIRVVLSDGTWGLVRASSNKPSLVVVTESPNSEKMMRDMFADIDRRLQAIGGVGPYDQKI